MSGSEALGAECWELMSMLVERLYDPDEQALPADTAIPARSNRMSCAAAETPGIR